MDPTSTARPLVTVVTPTTGAPELRQAIESVRRQSYPHVQHLVVVDGPREGAGDILSGFPHVDAIQLPYATGKDKFLGHRIYGASAYLARGELICFLDEDNWMDADHITQLAGVIGRGNDWAYSLRKIHDHESRYVCDDNCENLGRWPTCLGENDFLVDTNCYMMKRAVALTVSPLWYRRTRQPGKLSADRTICRALLKMAFKFDTTGVHSLNYRTGNRADSVQARFFLEGNAKMLARYGGALPWLAKKNGRDEPGHDER